jgi:3-phosphoshikimate 1-carboxyvinyltransferase
MLAIPLGKVEIKNPAVVSKSYPGFWNDLRSAGFEVNFY